MHSCIYEGQVRHRREQPLTHAFRYRMFAVYIDLAELGQLTGRAGIFSQRRWSYASFLRSDHLGDPNQSLDASVRELVEQKTGGFRPEGPIRLLTQLRYLGYYFSPLNLYYCFDGQGNRVEAIVAEVSNTPWREVHTYVLWEGNRTTSDGRLRFRHAKDFHVSPFMGMDSEYVWRLSPPGRFLFAGITTMRNQERFFDARMSLKRYPASRWQMRRMLMRFPWMTRMIIGQIYFEAWRLWRKKCPYYPHPLRVQPSDGSAPVRR
jgi:uncharacterized protein